MVPYVLIVFAILYVLFRIGASGIGDPLRKKTGIKEIDDLLK